MLQEAYDTSLFTHPWSLVPAGLTIALTVLAFNTMGDGLRDTLSGSATTNRKRGQPRASRQRGMTAVVHAEAGERTDVGSVAGSSSVLLEVRDLCIEFDTDAGPVRVVDHVSFDVGAGKIVGLVGESGCGKTVSSLSILRLLPTPPARIVGGSIRFNGQNLLDADFDELRQIRGRDIAMVFQDPLASLDPAFTIGYQLVEAIRLHEKVSRAAARDRAARLLESVHIPDPVQRLSSYPHQLSGGMRQRVMIAMALSCHPRLLIADEPTTALDVTVQAQIVELLRELRESTDLAVLFVTHDLALISEFSDEIAVMYAGQMVERAATVDMFAHPLHPYTAALLAAQPGIRETLDRPSLIAGQVPQAGQFPSGCRFNPRCDYAEGACRSEAVELTVVGGDRQCRCRRSEELTLLGVRTSRDPGRARRIARGGIVSTSTPTVPTVSTSADGPVAELVDVSCDFIVRLPDRGKGTVHAVDHVDLSVTRGRTLGLVGESGSGKSTLARLMLCLIRPTGGRVLLGGDDITMAKGARLRTLRRRMQLVFQDPYSSFDPLANIGSSIGEALSVHTDLNSQARELAGGRVARTGPAPCELRPPPSP